MPKLRIIYENGEGRQSEVEAVMTPEEASAPIPTIIDAHVKPAVYAIFTRDRE